MSYTFIRSHTFISYVHTVVGDTQSLPFVGSLFVVVGLAILISTVHRFIVKRNLDQPCNPLPLVASTILEPPTRH